MWHSAVVQDGRQQLPSIYLPLEATSPVGLMSPRSKSNPVTPLLTPRRRFAIAFQRPLAVCVLGKKGDILKTNISLRKDAEPLTTREQHLCRFFFGVGRCMNLASGKILRLQHSWKCSTAFLTVYLLVVIVLIFICCFWTKSCFQHDLCGKTNQSTLKQIVLLTPAGATKETLGWGAAGGSCPPPPLNRSRSTILKDASLHCHQEFTTFWPFCLRVWGQIHHSRSIMSQIWAGLLGGSSSSSSMVCPW